MLKFLLEKGLTPKKAMFGSVIGICVFIVGFIFMKFSIPLIIFLVVGALIGYVAGALTGTGIGVFGIISSDGKGEKRNICIWHHWSGNWYFDYF
jgi:hypothetical protein